MVGLDLFKEMIVRQFKYFASNYLRTGNPLRDDFLNAVFYGSPGVGKTKCGQLLAQFWKDCCLTNKQTFPVFQSGHDFQRRINELSLSASQILIHPAEARKSDLDIILHELVSCYQPMILPLIIPENREEIGTFSCSKSGILVEKGDLLYAEEETFPSLSIYTRGDFVGNYQGWSAKKTREIIEKNLGGVIFVDEAYTLITDENDCYGKEATTEIINFMDKHPHKIRWIFAGYREDIENGLFRYQPGFRRRFNWMIDLHPYSPKELSLIFRLQMKERDWDCTDEEFEKITEYFQGRKDDLSDNGGSTKLLCYSTECLLIERDWSEIMSEKSPGEASRSFTEKDVRKAFSDYSKTTSRKKNEHLSMYN